MAEQLAAAGWVVEVLLAEDRDRTDSRFFVVGTERADDAESSLLRFPGLIPADCRIARRRLSAEEISGAGLRNHAVRPHRAPAAG